MASSPEKAPAFDAKAKPELISKTFCPLIYQIAKQIWIQIYITLVCVSVYTVAVGTAPGDNSSDASLREDAAPQKAPAFDGKAKPECNEQFDGSAKPPSRTLCPLIYQMAMQIYITLVCASVCALAVATASGDNSSNAYLEEDGAPKKAMPGSTSGAVKAKRLMVIAVVAIASIFTMNGLHGDLKEQARRNFESPDLGLNESGAEGWGVLFRAGGPWHGEPANSTWKAQALPATFVRQCYFLHLGAFGGALGGGGQHLVIPMADDTSDWRAAVLERVRAVDSRLVPLVASMRCMLNSKEMTTGWRPEELQDVTSRWRSRGLLGELPRPRMLTRRRTLTR